MKRRRCLKNPNADEIVVVLLAYIPHLLPPLSPLPLFPVRPCQRTIPIFGPTFGRYLDNASPRK